MQAEFSRLDFLEALFCDYFLERQGFLLVRNQASTGPMMMTEYFASIEPLAALAFSPNVDVYYGVCPREEPNPSSNHIKYITAFWAHLDVGFKGHEGRERIFQSLEDANCAIKQMPYLPSIIVESGRGVHVYWLLEKPEEIDDKTKTENVLKALADLVGGVRGASLESMLRLPDTINNKIPGHATKCMTVFLDANARFSIRQLEELVSRDMHDNSRIGKAGLNIGQSSIIDYNSHEEVVMEVKRIDRKNITVESLPSIRVALENEAPQAALIIETDLNKDDPERFAWIAEAHCSSIGRNDGDENKDESDVRYLETTLDSNGAISLGAEPYVGDSHSEDLMEDESRKKGHEGLNLDAEDRFNQDDGVLKETASSQDEGMNELDVKDEGLPETLEDIVPQDFDELASKEYTETASMNFEEQFDEIVNRSPDKPAFHQEISDDQESIDETLNLDDSVLDDLIAASKLTGKEHGELAPATESSLMDEDSSSELDDAQDELRKEIEQAHDETVTPIPLEPTSLGPTENDQEEYETTETPLVMDKNFFHGLIDPEGPDQPYERPVIEEDIPGTRDMEEPFRESNSSQIYEADETVLEEHTFVDSTIDDIEMSDIDMEVDQQLDALIDAGPDELDTITMKDAGILPEQRHEAVIPGISVRWEGDEYTLIPDGIPPPSFAIVRLPIDPVLDRPRKILEIYEGGDRIGEIVVPDLRLTGTGSSELEMSVRNAGEKLQIQLTEKTTGWHLSFRLDLKR